jgi:hypothetical protein
MAITINTPSVPGQPPGGQRYAIANFTGDTSYPTGGYAVSISAWGFSNYMINSESTLSINSSTVYIVKYNLGTGMLQFFTAGSGGLAEVSNATDLHLFGAKITAYGY